MRVALMCSWEKQEAWLFHEPNKRLYRLAGIETQEGTRINLHEVECGVCVIGYLSISECVCVPVHVCVLLCSPWCMCVSIHVCVHICVCAPVCEYMLVCVRARTFVVCPCVHVFVLYTYVCACVYTCVHGPFCISVSYMCAHVYFTCFPIGYMYVLVYLGEHSMCLCVGCVPMCLCVCDFIHRYV